MPKLASGEVCSRYLDEVVIPLYAVSEGDPPSAKGKGILEELW
jgi:hypothetical protein